MKRSFHVKIYILVYFIEFTRRKENPDWIFSFPQKLQVKLKINERRIQYEMMALKNTELEKYLYND